MKILITGNMGYIGPMVVKHLRNSYPKGMLIGLDTGYFAHCLSNAVVFPECLVDIQYFADVRNVPAGTLDGIDGVVHLAAISNDPIGNAFEKITYDINYHASVNLAKKAKEAGVKSFVYASSCSVYGSADDAPRSEKSPLNPLTAYAKSKILTEQDLKKIADKNFTVTCLRFSTACGMSDRLRLDLVLNDFVACAVAMNKIEILSDGTPWRPLINVKDMARAIEWGLIRKENCGGDFLSVNIGSNDWNYQVKDLAEAVAKAIPGTEISINKNSQPDKRSYKVSFDLFNKLATEQYTPKLDLKTTIQDLRDGLEAMGFSDKFFRASNFIRLNVLSGLRSKGLLKETLEWPQKGIEQ
jgi:nucleoside-diphosphate-sugar epimerase